MFGVVVTVPVPLVVPPVVDTPVVVVVPVVAPGLLTAGAGVATEVPVDVAPVTVDEVSFRSSAARRWFSCTLLPAFEVALVTVLEICPPC